MRTLLLSLLLCTFGASFSTAQTSQVSQISGTVTDPNGAAIPEAQVTVTNTATAATRTVATGSDGTYTLTNLPVGTYRLQISKAGFASYLQTGIVLQVDTNPTIPVTLQIGSISQEVTVQADVPLVETHNAGVGQVVDQAKIVDLPLNGRNVTQLITLSGAATNVTNSTVGQSLVSNKNYPGATAVSIAGAQGGQTLFVLDGAIHMDPTSNVSLPMPMPDSLQEFKVETSSLPANYGSQPGGVVNVVSKSGTNTFHGTVFDFVRNAAMNARNFFASTGDGTKRNQFGGAIGGPILHNRLFFFAGYQGAIQHISPAANFTYVPTLAALNGDFTALASPACNGGKQITLASPFVNNRISPTLLNPVALQLAKLLPPLAPNSPPVNACGQVFFTVPVFSNDNQGTGRVDWQKSDRNSLFGRYFITNFSHAPYYQGDLLTVSNNTTSISPDSTVGLADRVQSIAIGDTFAISPNVVSAFHIDYSRSTVVRYLPSTVPTPTQLQQAAGLTPNLTANTPNYLNFSVTGAFGVACTNCAPSHFVSNIYQIAEDMTIVHNRHQIIFGGSWIYTQLNGYGGFQGNDNFTFNGNVLQAGGLPMADFLLGLPSSTLQSNGQVLHERVNQPSLYVQDNFKVKPQFSINFGLRWDPFLLPYNTDHTESIFDLGWFYAGTHSQRFTNAPVGTLFYGDPGMPGASYAYGKLANFSPRVALVYDPRGQGKESIRVGYGIFYGGTPLFLQVGTHAPWAGSISCGTLNGGLSNPYNGCNGVLTSNPFPTPNPPPSNVQFPLFGGGLGAFDLHPKPTYMQQWNMSLQKQLPGNWLVSATYLGNRTVHLELGESPNAVIYIPGNCVAGQYGLTKGGPCSTTGNENFRRALYLVNPSRGQYYGAITNFGYNANANYNGLLLSAQHPFAHNFTLLANETWSHCLGEAEIGLNGSATPQIPNDPQSDYGNCASDHRHVFNLAIVARTPQFQSAVLRWAISGWQIAPIFTAQTGGYFSISTGQDNTLGVVTRPNVIANPNLSNPTIHEWFKTSAFAVPAAGQFGNSGRDSILGPGAWDLDVALSRNFPITERQHVDFRAEAFNVFNHTRFNNPGSTMTSLATFGVIQSAQDPRILQLALKYNF